MRTISLTILLSIFTLSGILVSVTPVWSQTTYLSWENPDAPAAQNNSATQGDNESDERLRALIDELKKIIAQAEKDRAADPQFLKDLRALAKSFDLPTLQVVLFDDFSDGDFNQNPVWRVAEGRYWIEKDWGLRNALDKTEKKTTTSSSKDAAAKLFGQILTKALGGTTTSSGANTSTPAIQPTAIFHDIAISNAFAIELAFSSWVAEGNFILGPYQGSKRNTGYRLAYNVGGALELIAKSGSGARTIAKNRGPFKLEDQNLHTINWTRDSDGLMVITLDDKAVFELSDNSFRDPFVGFGMATAGGDFIVKKVTVQAIP